MRRPHMHESRGAILVIAAILLIVLLGIAALVLDIGRLLVLRTEMQNAADAAALAAARELDHQPHALDRARQAARDYLVANAHFAKTQALLDSLDDSAFTFYSWIGSPTYDTVDPPSDCTPDADNKCAAKGDDDAYYVRVTLAPVEGGTTEDQRYTIDLQFYPVLGSLFGDHTLTASATTKALAGRHDQAVVCNYPPMLYCDPTEGGGPDLVPGQQVLLKAQGGSASTWTPGTFGWLVPRQDADDPYDDHLSSERRIGHKLGYEKGQLCSPPTVSIYPGDAGNWPMWGLNTRFGLYQNSFFGSNKAIYPSAPDVVDYPRDRNLWSPDADSHKKSCEPAIIPPTRFGDGNWATTAPSGDGCPSAFGRADFNTHLHAAQLPSSDLDHLRDSLATRYTYYQWELADSTRLPNMPASYLSQLYDDEKACDMSTTKPCRMVDGHPFSGVPVGTADRRVLFVATVKCKANNVKSNTTDLNINAAGGRWLKFFLSEHIPPPSGTGVDIYAEFIKEAGPLDSDWVTHFPPLVQLYE